MQSDVTFALSIGLAMLAGLIVASEVGFRLARFQAGRSTLPAGAQVGVIQGALLGLLGLLLGFSFAAAGSRFMERQDLITAEANAIGTAFLRAELLDPTDRFALQSELRDYVADRLEISARLRFGFTAADAEAVARRHAQIWQATMRGLQNHPEAIVAMVDPVNEVIDLHSTRMAAGRKHLPTVIMALLIACSMLALALIGYGGGVAGARRGILSVSLAFIVATSLWITIDLDYTRIGMLKLSDAPLRELQLNPTPPSSDVERSHAAPPHTRSTRPPLSSVVNASQRPTPLERAETATIRPLAWCGVTTDR